ncbi:acyl-CoA dehydrogenase member 11 [Desmophyllum pertusum]|uniref:Acyl-CoA dehydrogenase member 11 n=1 Tax=Desmophyllum pertusum TaxID=174260 RepID=A0A9W9Z405_9CNID|nr:acyl-CoA dehydrogenase member 11 [Desmophyllum pertusum]
MGHVMGWDQNAQLIAQGIYAKIDPRECYSVLRMQASFGNMVEPPWPNSAGLKVAPFPPAQQDHKSLISKLNISDSTSIFQPSPKAQMLCNKMKAFMEKYVYPAEKAYSQHVSNPATQWSVPPFMDDLKRKARLEGLWNLFLPGESAEITGRCPFAPRGLQLQCTDTGNMEVLHLYGTAEQKKAWLEPLLKGDIRSAFCMTAEPDVASSDAHKHGVSNHQRWQCSCLSMEGSGGSSG